MSANFNFHGDGDDDLLILHISRLFLELSHVSFYLPKTKLRLVKTQYSISSSRELLKIHYKKLLSRGIDDDKVVKVKSCPWPLINNYLHKPQSATTII